MKRLFNYFLIVFLAVVLHTAGFSAPCLGPWSDIIVSDAEASHRGNGRGDNGRGGNGGNGGNGGGNCRGRRCAPPTVSELPIQYMVLSGAAAIALSGGIVFYIRKRKMQKSLEA